MFSGREGPALGPTLRRLGKGVWTLPACPLCQARPFPDLPVEPFVCRLRPCRILSVMLSVVLWRFPTDTAEVEPVPLSAESCSPPGRGPDAQSRCRRGHLRALASPALSRLLSEGPRGPVTRGASTTPLTEAPRTQEAEPPLVARPPTPWRRGPALGPVQSPACGAGTCLSPLSSTFLARFTLPITFKVSPNPRS